MKGIDVYLFLLLGLEISNPDLKCLSWKHGIFFLSKFLWIPGIAGIKNT